MRQDSVLARPVRDHRPNDERATAAAGAWWGLRRRRTALTLTAPDRASLGRPRGEGRDHRAGRAAGRRHSPATLPGSHAGRAPRGRSPSRYVPSAASRSTLDDVVDDLRQSDPKSSVAGPPGGWWADLGGARVWSERSRIVRDGGTGADGRCPQRRLSGAGRAASGAAVRRPDVYAKRRHPNDIG